MIFMKNLLQNKAQNMISNKKHVSENTAAAKLMEKLQEGRITGEQNGWLSEKDIEDHFAKSLSGKPLQTQLINIG